MTEPPQRPLNEPREGGRSSSRRARRLIAGDHGRSADAHRDTDRGQRRNPPPASRGRTGRRLDQPRSPRRFRLPRLDAEGFGAFAERFARFMGTASFLVYMTVFVALWLAFNIVGLFGFRWDPYPFILLNLFFSTQASYAAPLILLAQNRQDSRDRVQIEEDRRRADAAKADTEFLAREIAALRIALGEVATRDFLRTELNRFAEGDGHANEDRRG